MYTNNYCCDRNMHSIAVAVNHFLYISCVKLASVEVSCDSQIIIILNTVHFLPTQVNFLQYCPLIIVDALLFCINVSILSHASLVAVEWSVPLSIHTVTQLQPVQYTFFFTISGSQNSRLFDEKHTLTQYIFFFMHAVSIFSVSLESHRYRCLHEDETIGST